MSGRVRRRRDLGANTGSRYAEQRELFANRTGLATTAPHVNTAPCDVTEVAGSLTSISQSLASDDRDLAIAEHDLGIEGHDLRKFAHDLESVECDLHVLDHDLDPADHDLHVLEWDLDEEIRWLLLDDCDRDAPKNETPAGSAIRRGFREL